MIPAKKVNPDSKEKESASLEIVKLHQLVITEEIDDNEHRELNEVGVCKPEVVKNQGRVNMESRIQNAYEALKYNILRRNNNEELQEWKSYPGIKDIVRIARNAIEDNDRQDMDMLIEMMKVHESQQSAPIVATIAILLGSKLKNEVEKEVREAVGDMISWNVPIIKSKND